jgi:hypothetical protein
MLKTQMEERQKGVVDGIISAQLHIIKEALEKMKVDYLPLFMDRELAFKFDDDKEREIEEIYYQLSVRKMPILRRKFILGVSLFLEKNNFQEK